MAPRFSIVIPTRDRPGPLLSALPTCLMQRFDSFEVVVSDNGTGDGAREVVEAVGDTRFRYARTPRSLAMTDSWEFAIEQASGEYVLLMDDDDGLLFHALTEI